MRPILPDFVCTRSTSLASCISFERCALQKEPPCLSFHLMRERSRLKTDRFQFLPRESSTCFWSLWTGFPDSKHSSLWASPPCRPVFPGHLTSRFRVNLISRALEICLPFSKLPRMSGYGSFFAWDRMSVSPSPLEVSLTGCSKTARRNPGPPRSGPMTQPFCPT